jgi:hypothetical protein
MRVFSVWFLDMVLGIALDYILPKSIAQETKSKAAPQLIHDILNFPNPLSVDFDRDFHHGVRSR